MNVYVAKREYDYEGFIIIGIFTTREAAQACCDNDFIPMRESEFPREKIKYGDSHDVEEYELKE